MTNDPTRHRGAVTPAEHAARLMRGELRRAATLAGGDLSRVVAIELADGRRAVAKGGPAPAVEAGMLTAIRAAGVPAPAVIAHDATVLVIEQLPAAGRPESAWSHLGTVLARLHAKTRTRYGWHADYAFGTVAIENTWASDWPGFWAERRLASQTGHLPAELARRLEALAGDLPNRLPAAPPPSLLHGDLWGGNILADGDAISGLIDPACYYGDREVDLAMLGLFNAPDQAFFAAYGPLEPGYEARLPIYQLWPALVHLGLFGSAYRPLVERLLAAAGC